MRLSTIDLSREEAEAALEEWGAEVKKSKTAPEDAAIAAGYEALAKGKSLISLSSTLAEGGQDEHFRPRLAIAPTTAKTVFLRRFQSGDVAFAVSERPDPERWQHSVSTSGVIVPRVLPPIDHSALHTHRLTPAWNGVLMWKAMVPIVPPRFRHRGYKSKFVLFEAEWAAHEPPAPVDPALISHLRGDLWVVHGVWDLTPLERAVLMERNRLGGA